MSDLSKQELAQVFKRLRLIGPNKVRLYMYLTLPSQYLSCPFYHSFVSIVVLIYQPGPLSHMEYLFVSTAALSIVH